MTADEILLRAQSNPKLETASALRVLILVAKHPDLQLDSIEWREVKHVVLAREARMNLQRVKFALYQLVVAGVLEKRVARGKDPSAPGRLVNQYRFGMAVAGLDPIK